MRPLLGCVGRAFSPLRKELPGCRDPILGSSGASLHHTLAQIGCDSTFSRCYTCVFYNTLKSAHMYWFRHNSEYHATGNPLERAGGGSGLLTIAS